MRRQRRGRPAQRGAQSTLFDDPDHEESVDVHADVGELERDVNRMTLETSSGVYARRRAE